MEIWKFWKRISVDKIQCCGGGEQSPKNSFKRLYIVRGCCFWSKKLRFRKNYDANFNAVERVTVVNQKRNMMAKDRP